MKEGRTVAAPVDTENILAAGQVFQPRPATKIDPPLYYSSPTRVFADKKTRLAKNKSGEPTLTDIKPAYTSTGVSSYRIWDPEQRKMVEVAKDKYNDHYEKNRWKPGSRVDVALPSSPPQYHLTIIDNGRGVNPTRSFRPCAVINCNVRHVDINGNDIVKDEAKDAADRMRVNGKPVDTRHPSDVHWDAFTRAHNDKPVETVALPPFSEPAVLGYPDQAERDARKAARGSTSPSFTSEGVAPLVGVATEIDRRTEFVTNLDKVIRDYDTEQGARVIPTSREFVVDVDGEVTPTLRVLRKRGNRRGLHGIIGRHILLMLMSIALMTTSGG
jgi:hypothetical protein